MLFRRRHPQRIRITTAALWRYVALSARACVLTPSLDARQVLSTLSDRNQLAFEMFRCERYSLTQLAQHLSISEPLALELIYQTLVSVNTAFKSSSAAPEALLHAAIRQLLELLHTPTTLAASKAWPQTSAAHTQAWQHACALWLACKNLPSTHLPNPRSSGRQWLAAVLVIGVIGALIVIEQSHNTLSESAKTFVLADASRVELAPFSSVEFDPLLKQRLALKQGVMFVDNSQQTAQRLEVNLNEIELRSQYSAFEVQNHSSTAAISVLRGHVEVRLNGTATPITLLAGQQLRYVRQGMRIDIVNYPIEHMALWRQGLFWVDNMPLAHSLEQLDRQLAGLTLILDPTLAQAPVSGVFRSNQPQQTLHTLLEPLGARVEEYGPWLRLVSRSTP